MKEALTHYPGHTPSAALLFSCAARRQILGSRTAEEYKLIKLNMRDELPACGFYANGEISPLQQRGQTYFHNETFVTVLIGES